jgi:hypothetical protein
VNPARLEILGKVAELSQRQAANLLTQQMQVINGDDYSPKATRKFVDSVRVDWEPVIAAHDEVCYPKIVRVFPSSAFDPGSR